MKNRLPDIDRNSINNKKKSDDFRSLANKEMQDDDPTSTLIKDCQKALQRSIISVDDSITNLSILSEKIYSALSSSDEKNILTSIKEENTKIHTEMAEIRKRVIKLQDTEKELQADLKLYEGSKKKSIRLKATKVASYVSMIKNLISMSKTNLSTRIDKYNQISIQINEYQRRDIKKLVNVINPDLDDEKISRFLQETEAGDFGQYTSEERERLEEAKKRKEMLLEFEKNVAELLQLLSNMNSLVLQSSDMLDSVEFNIMASKEDALEGRMEIEKAFQSYLASKRCKYMTSALVLAGGVLLVYWFFRTR